MWISSRQRVLPVALACLVGLAGTPATGTLAPAQAAEAALVLAALEILRDNHVDKPDPIRLLVAALDGIRGELTRAGVSETLADLPTDTETNARATFLARLEQAIRLAQGKRSETELQYSAAEAMVVSLGGPQSDFLTPAQVAEKTRRQQQGQLGFAGIGAVMTEREGRIYLWHVFPGSPAARAGLRDLDRLLAVEGQSTQGMTLDDVVRLVRGAQGTVAAVTVQRAGQKEPLTFSVTREPIATPPIEYTLSEGGVGYVRLPASLPSRSGEQLRQALQEMREHGMAGLVIDIRGGSLGFYSALDAVAETILPAGSRIYRTHTAHGTTMRETQATALVDQSVRLVVVVDGTTQALGTLLAAAIQEHRRGTVVGVRTSGVGQSGQAFPLPGGAEVWVKTFVVTTGAGVNLVARGVEPDVVVALGVEDIEQGIDAQLQRALQIVRASTR